jgi:hypothetical protein
VKREESENIAKCLGRGCSQAFLCWHYLAPSAQEGQKWTNYDEQRQMDAQGRCDYYWPVVREPVPRRSKLVRPGVLAA